MALLLRDVVGLSYTEIAETLEVTLATVKWRIYKAREEVQLALHRDGVVVPITLRAVGQERLAPIAASALAPYDGRRAAPAHATDPVARLADALAELAGSPVSLERPADAEHGDYATNVALKLAGLQKRPPREIADEIAAQVVERGLAERAEAAGPGFVNLWVPDAWLARRRRRDRRRGRRIFGAGSRVETRADPGGDGLREPDRADHRRACAKRRVRRLRRTAARVRRARRSSASTTTTTRASQMERFYASVEAVAARGGATGGRLHGRLRRGARRARRRSRAARCSSRSRRRSSASGSTSTPGRARADVEPEIPEAVALLDTFEEDGALWARTSAHGDDKDRVLVRSDGTPDVLREGRGVHSAEVRRAASTASSTSSAPTTTATSRGSRRSPRCSGTRASRSRC